eukprot:4225443-Pleurochrysis_carterae.AAC.4
MESPNEGATDHQWLTSDPGKPACETDRPKRAAACLEPAMAVLKVSSHVLQPLGVCVDFMKRTLRFFGSARALTIPSIPGLEGSVAASVAASVGAFAARYSHGAAARVTGRLRRQCRHHRCGLQATVAHARLTGASLLQRGLPRYGRPG